MLVPRCRKAEVSEALCDRAEDDDRHPSVVSVAGFLELRGQIEELASQLQQREPTADDIEEVGDTAPTLWHHDINYLPVEPPDQFASAWVALDDADAAVEDEAGAAAGVAAAGASSSSMSSAVS